MRARRIAGTPYCLNEEANWNNQTKSTKEGYLDEYMTKNLSGMSVDSLSDEEKRRLAQELLASLQASAGGENADDAAAQEAPVQEEKSDEQNTDEKSE